MSADWHSMAAALGYEKFTAVRTKFSFYTYMVMSFSLINAAATFLCDIYWIFWPFLVIKFVIDTKQEIDKDGAIVIFGYIDDILIRTKGCIEKHQNLDLQCFQLLMHNDMRIVIAMCIFHSKEVPLLGFVRSGTKIQMDSEKATAIVAWPRRTNQQDVHQLLRL